MSCIFHLYGDDVDVDKLLTLCPIEPCSVFRKGQPRSSRPTARVSNISGINLVVSSAEFEEFEQQQTDAIKFIRENLGVLQEMRSLSGVGHASLDFGIAMRSVVVQSDEFVPELLQLVANLNCGLALSQYPAGKNSRNLGRYRKALREAS